MSRRSPFRRFAFRLSFVPLLGLSSPLVAQEKEQKPPFQLKADLRLRFERDWDVTRADGNAQADRDRLRLRARISANFNPAKDLEIGFRIRTGAFGNQQSSNITLFDFDDNPTGDKSLVPDLWYVRYSGKKGWIWAGRNQYPFWRQNDLFWDDDVTLPGVAGGTSAPLGKGKLNVATGYFARPDGAIPLQGSMAAGQLLYSVPAEHAQFNAATALYYMNGKPDSHYLRNGNDARDYLILTGHLQATSYHFRFPVALGFDLYRNARNYSQKDPDPFTARNHDQTLGWAATITLGQLARKADWLVSYVYADIEALAIHASYAQDDWFRWGNSDQVDASNFKGHEFRGGYAILKNMNIQARLFLTEGLTTLHESKRFRTDLNYVF